jgi:hypothetical protein
MTLTPGIKSQGFIFAEIMVSYMIGIILSKLAHLGKGDVMNKNLFNAIVGLAIIIVFAFGFSQCVKAETLTKGDILSAEKVLKRQDGFKNVFAGVCAAFNGVSFYSSAAAMGATGAALIQPAMVGAVIGGVYCYGAAAIGERVGLHLSAKAIQRELDAMGTAMIENGKALQK